MCRGTTCTFPIKLPAFAGTCRYRACSVQERQNTCTVQVNLPARFLECTIQKDVGLEGKFRG